MGLGRKIRLDQADIDAVRNQISGVRLISSETMMGGVTITYGDKNAGTTIRGANEELFRVREDVPFTFGRKPNILDGDDVRKIVVIGKNIADRLFANGEDPVGKEVEVKEVVFKVVGVFYDKGNRGQNSDNIFIPQSTFDRVYGGAGRVDALWVRPKAGVDGFELEKQILGLLRRRHDVAPDDKRGIGSFNMAEPAKAINGLFTGITVFIWFVGLGTLTAGIVGISNIMIITVKERTKEIGIRKALGATPFSIVSTLLLESTLVTAIAGYIGLVLGVGLLELIAFGIRKSGAQLPYFTNPEVDFQVAVTAICLLVGVGVLAGLMPALRAAKITPTEAMKAD
jgi:putative ABC transport system permease protein